jgi:hypothetical protein
MNLACGEDGILKRYRDNTFTRTINLVRPVFDAGKEFIMIEKIEQTLDVVIPLVILALSVLQLSGAITVVEQVTPVLYAVLSAALAIFKIWGITLRRKNAKSAS